MPLTFLDNRYLTLYRNVHGTCMYVRAVCMYLYKCFAIGFFSFFGPYLGPPGLITLYSVVAFPKKVLQYHGLVRTL